jgi:hypothetical protein
MDKILMIQGRTRQCSVDLAALSDNCNRMTSLIDDSFLQIMSFLGQITPRPLPVLCSLEKEINKQQKYIDQIFRENEAQEKSRLVNDHFNPVIIDMDFNLPEVSLAMSSRETTPTETQRRQRPMVFEPEEIKSNFNAVGSEVEFRRNMINLKAKMEEFLGQMDEYKMQIEKKMNEKADLEVIDRMGDRMREALWKVRDSSADTRRVVMGCLQRTEAEALIRKELNEIDRPALCTSAVAYNWSHLKQNEGLAKLSGSTAHQAVFGRRSRIASTSSAHKPKPF